MRRIWFAVLAGSVLLGSPSPAARAEDAEDRLVSAELLEVSAGDFEKARAAFKALSDDEKAPAAARSRALLGLARCQRKLGQLEAAKKTLEDLLKNSVKDPAKDPEVLRQAKSYLRELAGGRPENPDFDWVREIEKNPEIQARVFDWAMELAGLPSDRDPPAGRQLLALGTIALPVVERVLDASRDPVHRQHLAIIAFRSGRIERLAVLLDAAEPAQLDHVRISRGVEEICARLSGAPAEERKKVLELLAGVPGSPRTEAVRAAFEIACGEADDLARKLLAIETSALFRWMDPSEILDLVPEAANVFAASVLDRSRSLDTRLRYFNALLEKSPARITADAWMIVEEVATLDLPQGNRNRTRSYVERLEGLGKLDVLQRLAAGNAGEQIIQWFDSRYVKPKKLGEAPGTWGAVLRRQGKRDHSALLLLERLAEANDEAAVELAAFLRARSVEAPGFKPTPEHRDPAWAPSPKYAELMTRLLDVQDQVVLQVALEALALAEPKAEPDILPVLERIVMAPSSVKDVRAAALKTLLRHLGARPETAGPTIAALYRKAQRQFSEDPAAAGVAEAVGSTPGTVRLELFRHALALDLDPGDAQWLGELFGQLPGHDGWKLILDSLPKLDTPGKRLALLGYIWPEELTKNPAGLEFLHSIATDSRLGTWVRLNAAHFAGEVGMAWLDWTKLAEAGDPIVEAESDPRLQAWLLQRPGAEQDAFLEVLSRSKSEVLRESRLDIYPRDRPEYPDVLSKALEDPSERIQDVAVRYLLKVEKLQGPALYTRLLEHPRGRRLSDIYGQIIALGDPQMLEPLVKVLDDPDPKVREQALRTLTSIRKNLDEKKEWQAIIQAAKERRKE